VSYFDGLHPRERRWLPRIPPWARWRRVGAHLRIEFECHKATYYRNGEPFWRRYVQLVYTYPGVWRLQLWNQYKWVDYCEEEDVTLIWAWRWLARRKMAQLIRELPESERY